MLRHLVSIILIFVVMTISAIFSASALGTIRTGSGARVQVGSGGKHFETEKSEFVGTYTVKETKKERNQGSALKCSRKPWLRLIALIGLRSSLNST